MELVDTNPKSHKFRSRSRRAGERGQATAFLVLALGIFLIGGVGFVVDGANIWFHRQNAQTAADAACTSGAMDLLSNAAGVTPPATGWIPATDDGSLFHCSGKTGSTQNSSFPPCSYASLNGYSGSSSQDVQVSFPKISVAANCPDIPPFSPATCHADDVAATPYLHIDIQDSVPNTFMRLVGAGPNSIVPAKSTCGLTNVLSPVPILVLNPNAPNGAVTSTFGGSGNLTVFGAPKSIQVNSTDGNAVNLSGTIDLSNATAGDEDGQFAVAGRESESDAGVDPSVKWVNAAGIGSDPFAIIPKPSQAQAQSQGFEPVRFGTTGCIGFTGPPTQACCPGLSAAVACDDYRPGYYPPLSSIGISCAGSIKGDAAICVGTGPGYPTGSTGLAIFEPGTYYLAEDFYAGSNSCLRSATGASDGGGSMFYLSGPAVLNVAAGSGASCATSVSSVSLSDTACPGGSLNLPTPVSVTGNVLFAPCTGNYGDPSGAGKVRGLLFFQDRDQQQFNQAFWNGSSSSFFGLVGNLYIHRCHSSPAGGSGANCDPDAFTETLNLGSNGYIVGGIVTDQLALTGGSTTVVLNPNPQYYVLKASLLQ